MKPTRTVTQWMVFGAALAWSAMAGAQNMVGVSGGSGGGYSNPGSFFIVDQTTGAVTILGTPYGGVGLTGVAVSPSGQVFATTSVTNPDDTSHLIEINPTTGALVNDIGAMYDASGNGCGIGDLSFQPGTGVLFAVAANQSDVGTRCGVGGSTGGYLMTVNTSTARYTIIGRDASLDNETGGLGFAPDGTLYFTPGWNAVGVINTLDPATGNILTTQALGSGEGYQGMAVRPSDSTIFVSFRGWSSTYDNRIFTIDPTTGVETVVGDPGDIMVQDLEFLGQTAVGIPTLSSWGRLALVLLLAGIAGLIVRRRLS